MFIVSGIDPCGSNPCQNGGTCALAGGGSCSFHVCSCPGCYTGANCEILQNPCNNHACQNGAACQAVPGSCSQYQCVCQGCYSGQFCTTCKCYLVLKSWVKG